MIRVFFRWIGRLILVGLLVLAIAAGCVFIDNRTVQLTPYDFFSANLPLEFYGYKILCVSDYHNAYFYDQIAQIINRQQPDLLLFLGDMATMYEYQMDNLQKLLDAIDPAITQIYGVLGNHEYFALDMENVEDILPVLAKTRIQILDDSYIDLKKDGAQIRLIGIRDVWIDESQYSMTEMPIRFRRDYLSTAVDPEHFNLLMAHRADLYPYLNDLGIDLIVSGHLHGGVVRLPVVGGIFGHESGTFLPPYDAGIYQESPTAMIVSRGCDYDPLRCFRVFNGPEVVSITLRR